MLVHAGSASFGHYYALIKDVDAGEWHEFNANGGAALSFRLCTRIGSTFSSRVVSFLDKMTDQGFLAPEHRDALKVDHRVEGLLKQFDSYEAPDADVRLKTQQT